MAGPAWPQVLSRRIRRGPRPKARFGPPRGALWRAPAASAVVSDYWISDATATRTRTGVPALTAKMVRTAATTTSTVITSGATATLRTARVTSAYDTATGLLRYTDDQGDISKPVQEICTSTTYAPANATRNLIGLPYEVDQGACSTGNSGTSSGLGAPAGISRPTDVVSDVRTYYDTDAPTSWPPALPTSQSTPTVGESTLIAVASGYAGGAFTYQVKSAADYDAYGRTSDVWDALGNKTGTAYTTPGGQTTTVTLTNAKNQVTTSTVDAARGSVTETVDANSAKTDTTYDALGRATAVWLPGRDKASQSADYTYTYALSQTVPSSVTTKQLNEDTTYTASVQIYDGMLRPRQTQAQTPQGGRLLTDTYYDSRGLVWKSNHAYWDGSSGPNTSLVGTTDPQVTDQDLTTYDGLGRPVLTVAQYKGTVKEKTQTVYGGDRVTTIPLTGGTTSSTLTDARGRTVETDAYQTTPTVSGDQIIGGSPAATKFTYDAPDSHGQNSAITDPGLNQRTYIYNLLGQKLTQTDPDTGTTHLTYDADGRVLSTSDARGKTVSVSYDVLGRKTAQYDGPDSSSPKLADWTYDNPAVPHSVGRVTASSHYDADGNAYTEAVNGYNIHGDPNKTTTTIPANVTGLSGSYSYFYGYTPNLGLPLDTIYPAVGNLPSETVSYGYTSLGLMDSVGGLVTYANLATFDAFARVTQMTAGNTSNPVVFTNSYDEHTGALNNAHTSRAAAPQDIQDTTYTRNLAGDITKITDNRLGTPSDTQCFSHDGLGRMTDAWTATDGCAGAPTSSGSNPTVGGGDPSTTYWTSWTFDIDGNRKSQIQHGTSGISAATTTTYTYGKPGAPATQPDTLTSTQTTSPDGTTTGGSYVYDDAGNTTTRTTTPGTDTLVWNDEGHVASFKTTGQSAPTTYTYDAEGSQLLRHDPNGRTTLFLPDQEVVYDPSLPAGSSATATRYVSLPGGVTATRTGAANNAFSFTATNDQATGTTSIDDSTQTPTFRLLDPYGNPRGTQPTSWPGDKGFVGGTQDPTTGLTRLGVRDYDPTIGRFTSADPVLEATDPNQIGGYAYAGDSPITQSDPSGLYLSNKDGSSGTCSYAPGAGEYACPGSSDPGGDTIDETDLPNQESGGEDVNHDGRSTISPGVDIPTHWVKKDQFILAFRQHMSACDQDIYSCPVAGPGDEYGLAVVKMAVCSKIGGCPKNIASTEATFMAGLLTYGLGGSDANGSMGDMMGLRGTKKWATNAAKGGCLNSFPAATGVQLADGAKNIDHVRVGDQVIATDPTTGTTKPETVTAVIITKSDNDFTDLTIQTPTGKHTLTSTQHHPYWDTAHHQWKNAADLHPGDRLREPNGTTLTVTAVRNYHRHITTYNLTVDHLHTYYVLAGDTPVLVHNNDSNCGIRPHDKARGAAGVDEMTETFEKFYNKSDIYSESYGNGLDLWTPYGRREVDIAVRNPDGNFHLYEVKVNKSNYTRSQRRKDNWLAKTYGFETPVVRRTTVCPICNP